MLTTENIAIAVIVLLLVYVYVKYHSTVVYRFYRPTCGYCVSSQAEWDKFCQNMTFKLVRCINVNLDKPGNESLAKTYNVVSVPTIIKVTPCGESTVYSGERTAKALAAWV
jgi:thiol-disulfide isomerase/thioredoxin